MELMVFANQKKLESLKVTVCDLKGRANILENRLDDIECVVKQNQKEQNKKKNRRTSAEISKSYNVVNWNI